ncbi:MAG: hypothetical protein D6702_04285 [Planctomycetota bacterium]|nr:MAG: hypothetical protein D6702_04285 [Planctomycetota bacterium]
MCTLLLHFLLSCPWPLAQSAGGGWVVQEQLPAANGLLISVGCVGDLDGDGRPDLAQTVQNPAGIPYRLEIIGSDGGHRLWSRPLGWGPTRLGDAGDLDGDGIPDLAAAAPNTSPAPFLPAAGLLVFFSGADGHEIDRLEGRHAWDRFGSAFARLDDLDGDAVPEFAVGLSGEGSLATPRGAVEIRSGSNRRLLLRIVGQSPGSSFGFALAAVLDADGDGHRDLVVGAPAWGWERGRAAVYSTATGRELTAVTGRIPGGRLGHAVAPPPFPTYGGFDFLAGEPGDGAGAVHAFDLSGRTQWTVRGVEPDQRFGAAILAGGSLDEDMVPDHVFVAAAPDALDVWVSAELWLSRPGGPERRWVLPLGGSGPASLTVVGDWNGDGLDELVRTAGFHGERIGWSPFLEATRSGFSAAAGAGWRYLLRFPAELGGERYALLLSLAGVGPTTIQGLAIPLGADPLFFDTLAGWVPPGFAGAHGRLDPDGRGRVEVQALPGQWSALAGRTLQAAAVTYRTSAEPLLASAAAGVEIRR